MSDEEAILPCGEQIGRCFHAEHYRAERRIGLSVCDPFDPRGDFDGDITGGGVLPLMRGRTHCHPDFARRLCNGTARLCQPLHGYRVEGFPYSLDFLTVCRKASGSEAQPALEELVEDGSGSGGGGATDA